MVPVQVIGYVLAFTVSHLVKILHNRGSGRLRCGEVDVHVIDEHGQGLRSVTQVGGSWAAARILQHDARFAQAHLRAADRSARFAIAVMFTETERLVKPGDGSGDVPIMHMRQNGIRR